MVFNNECFKNRHVVRYWRVCMGLPPPSLVPRPRAPPGKKWSGEQSQISWAYSLKVVRTNEIARLVIIKVFISTRVSIPFLSRFGVTPLPSPFLSLQSMSSGRAPTSADTSMFIKWKFFHTYVRFSMKLGWRTTVWEWYGDEEYLWHKWVGNLWPKWVGHLWLKCVGQLWQSEPKPKVCYEVWKRRNKCSTLS